MYNATLTCHPDTRAGLVTTTITVNARWLADSRLELRYVIVGDCNQWRVPPLKAVSRVDGLWQHTCCEAFFAGLGDLGYREYNFSPSREWAVYVFRGYRDRVGEDPDQSPPEIVMIPSENAVVLSACLRLPEVMAAQPLQLGLSTVLEDNRGTLSYWSLRHPPGKPDFHHRDAFALLVNPRPSHGSIEGKR